VARLYPAPPRASSRRSLPQPDFPHELARPSDYGEGAPDIPYGPPLLSDSGRSPLTPLDLSEEVEDALDSVAGPPRRSPVDAVETGAMLQARAGRRVRVSNVGSLRAGPDAFKAAAFADAPSAADQHVRVAFDTVALPELSFSAARSTSQETETQAFGATWRLSATTRGTWLVVRLEMVHRGADQRLLMLPLPLGACAGESAGAAIDLDAPPRQELLPVNIAVQAGPSMRTNGVLLDSHAVFGLGDGAPRSWSHVIYVDKLRDWPTAELPLRVTLQAVRVLVG
jgi:hypothetical protein